VKGKTLWHVLPTTHARTGVSSLPSRFVLLQKLTALRHEFALLSGLKKWRSAARFACTDARALSTSESPTRNRHSRLLEEVCNNSFWCHSNGMKGLYFVVVLDILDLR
jgi:hypothetical protein